MRQRGFSLKSQDKKYKNEIEKAPKVSAEELLKDYDFKGNLMKQGGSFKNWKKRLCILHSGRLYYYVKKTDLIPKGMINVTGLSCDRVNGLVNGRPYGLKIISPHRTYYVCAKNDEKADQWLKAINESAALNAETMVHVVDADQSSDVKFHAIEEAIEKASENDCIIIRSGTYVLKETLQITKPLHLRGAFDMDGGRKTVRISIANPSISIVSVQNTYNQQFQLSHVTLCPYEESVEKQHRKKQKKSNGEVINGSTETNGSSDKYSSVSCIQISNGCKCKIEDVEIHGSIGQGIIVDKSAQLTLDHCFIGHNTQNGIVSSDSSQISITNTTVIDNNGYFGILVKDSAQLSISDSTISNNRSHPIRHESSNRIKVIKNKICTTKEPHISMKQGSEAESTENQLLE